MTRFCDKKQFIVFCDSFEVRQLFCIGMLQIVQTVLLKIILRIVSNVLKTIVFCKGTEIIL